MTSLRLLSAHARVDLLGMEHLSAAVAVRVRGVIGQLEIPLTAGDDVAQPDRTVRVAGHDARAHLEGTQLPDDPDLAAAAVVAAQDRALLSATPCLTVHAAMGTGPRGAAIVPGVSGAGKSALAGACLQRGLLLVSDEAACLDPERDVVWPHPRPLGLDRPAGSCLAFRRPPTVPSTVNGPPRLPCSERSPP